MKTAHVLFSISLVGASSAFVFTSPLLPSSKNVSMQKKSKISAVRDELRKILSISDPLEREDALVDLTVDKEKRAENAENLYREERLLNTNLTRTLESLSKDKEQAIQSAGLGEFLLFVREGVAHFAETWSAGMPTDVHPFAVEISKKTNITTDRLKKGKKHFRKWMYILVSGDADRCISIGKLRKSLKENPIKYLWFASQMEVIFEVLCEPAHPKNPLKMKYMDKSRFMEYAEIFVGEPRDAIIRLLENVFY